MAYESTEDRLEKLEHAVEELSAKIGQMAAIIKSQREVHLAPVRLFILMKADHISMLRLLTSSPFVTDENVRQHYLAQIARMESDFEKLEATFVNVPGQKGELPPGSPV